MGDSTEDLNNRSTSSDSSNRETLGLVYYSPYVTKSLSVIPETILMN